MFKSSSWANTRFRRKDGWLDHFGVSGSDRMINLRVTIDMSFRFRFALFLCAFIILVNILFKVQTDIVDSTIYKQSRAAIYQPAASRSSDNIPEVMGRDLDEGFAPDLVNRGSERLARLMRNRNARNRMRQAEEDSGSLRGQEPPRREEDWEASQGSCRAGHIPGLGSICDSKGCLRKLGVPPKQTFRDEPMSEADRRNIDYLPGWLDPVHYDLIPLVTDVQWNEGVYGSVGELSVGVGKLTSLLTYNVDQSVGELLFVSDDFSSQQVIVSGDRSTYDTFVENISGCGYTVTDITSNRDQSIKSTSSKTVYVHKGNIMDLDKELFSRWDMPQFRLIAVDATEDMNPVNLLSSLIISSCILTDGGVMVINGVDEDQVKNHIITCLTQYFNGIQLTPPVLVPLLSARNRLYLTTAGYRQLYTDQLLKKAGERLGSALLQVTTATYGRTFTYLTLGD